MDVGKLLVVVAVAVAVVLPAAAHVGPEQHPTEQELEEVASDLRSALGEVDRRLGQRLNALEAPVIQPDEQAIADAVERAVGQAAAGLGQSSNELEDWVDAIVAIGAVMMAGLTGVSAFLGFRVRALRKLLLRSSQDASETEEARAEPTDRAERKAIESEERTADGRRIVTHTLKTRISPGMRPTIKELHNPGASWSPRTVEDAVADIRDRGIQYWARGPKGNEAEIEVRKGSGKSHLRTKPDEHGGNNLSELPDPP